MKNLTDGADTTEQLSDPGTFVTNNNGVCDTDGLTGTMNFTADGSTEFEFCVQLVGDDIPACGEGEWKIELRLVEEADIAFGANRGTYTQTPTFGGSFVDIPTPFDDLTTTGWQRAIIGGGGAGTKSQGAIDIRLDAAQKTCDAASPSTTDQGYSMEFNGTPSAVDMTDEIFIVSHAFNAPNRIQCETNANRGNVFGLHTSDANYKEWRIGGNDTAIAYKPNHKCIIIDPASTARVTGGSGLTITSVLYYKKISRRLDISGNSTCLWFLSRAIRCSTLNSGNITRIYGGACSWNGLEKAVNGTGYIDVEHNYVIFVGTAIFVGCPVSIGKSGEETNFCDGGTTIVSPESNSTNDPRFHLSDTAMRVYFDSMGSTDTAHLTGTYQWGTRAAWNMNTTAVITLEGASFSGMGAITMGEGITGNANFDDVGLITLDEDGDLDGSNFSNPDDDHLLSIG